MPAYRYFKDTLPSGLRVVTVEMPHLHTAMLSAYVRTGSRHETPETNGVSHFLEHMFFRGSRRHRDTVKMNAAVENVGGNLNGITSRDHGYYYTPIHPDALGVGIEILGDMLTRPLFPKVEVERKIILEEMLDEVDDKGRDIDLDNLSKMALFPQHPLSLKIAGTPASVKALTLRQLKAHHAAHYVTGNLVFAATGPVKRAQVVEQVAKAFSALPPGPATTEAPPAPPKKGPWLTFVAHDESQTELRLNFPAVPEHHEDFPALTLLRRVLDDGLSSRLPHEVVERRGLAYSVHAAMDAFHDVGLFEVDAASTPKKAPEVLSAICRVLGALSDRKVTAEELRRAQRRYRMLLDFAQDSVAELSGWYGGTELFRRPEGFEERCRVIDAQTPARLQQVARRYFNRKNLGVVAVGPRTSERGLARATLRAEGLP